ncbi:hypothetical protein [uncultured Shewanella sp.]|uniref:hypothetical protein n=1 Tax=uncultured Shewanella sp. TaxID=173975 RepID=UPI00263304AE|nr:hypothetical protein [uncultured Shewanella sp.]
MFLWFKRRLLCRGSRHRLSSENLDVNWTQNSHETECGIWEHIADFFHSVYQEEAQKALFDLVLQQECDTQKYDAFHRLRQLAADIFYDKFIEEGVKNIDGSWDITILIKGWHIDQNILQLHLKAVNGIKL